MYYSRGAQAAAGNLDRDDRSFFVVSNFLKKYINFFIICMLFVGFISSSYFTFKIPVVRLFAIALVFVYLLFSLYSNCKNCHMEFIQQSTLIFFLIFQVCIDQLREFPSSPAVFIAMLLAVSFYKKNAEIYNILKFVIVVNFLVMLYEFFSYTYLINIVEVNKYEHGRLQGLFSYSKEAGFFLFMAFLYGRNCGMSFCFKIILFVSAMMSGCRTAILFIALVLFIDSVFFLKTIRNTFRNFFLKKMFQVILLILFSSLFLIVFFDHNYIMVNRILSSFDFTSSSHVARLEIWQSYMYNMANNSFIEWLFGTGTYLNVLVGNGSENTYLMILSQWGMSGLFLFMFPMVLVLILFFRYPLKLYPAVLMVAFLGVGRLGVGWADGVLMWCYIYNIIFNTNRSCLTFNDPGFSRVSRKRTQIALV